jgi:UPF0716 protein FxsA
MRFKLLLLAIPLAEIMVIIWVGGVIGVLATLGLLLLGMFGGIFLLRQTGLGLAATMQTTLATSRNIAPDMFANVLLVVAAVLLILPGFLSDLVAVMLLPRPVRSFLVQKLATIFTVTGNSADSTIIDAEYEVLHADAPRIPTQRPD